MGQAAKDTSGTIAAAMSRLGVTPEMSWREVRGAYHDRVREVHPDVANSALANEMTGELNHALEVLRKATNSGALALPDSTPLAPMSPVLADGHRQDVVTMYASPGDVFVQLLDAAYELGTVSYIDPEAGLIQVLLDNGPAAPQLLIDVDQSVDPPRVAFTLDTMSADDGPDIHDVVAEIAANII